MRKFLFIFLLFVLIPTVNGISIVGPKISPLTFQPGMEFSATYVVQDIMTENIEVGVRGELSEYLSISEVVDNQFTLVAKFPEYLEPGTRRFYVTASEVSDSSSGIALTSASQGVRVNVHAYTKSIEASLLAPSVNEGTPVPFELKVHSVGYPDIDSVSGEITVYGKDGKVLAVLETDKQSLSGLDSLTLKANFKTIGLPVAEYHADAKVYYDGEEFEVKPKIFRIGNIDLDLVNYTHELRVGFSEFGATVRNNWGNPLNQISAKILLNGNQVLQTPTISLDAWSEGEIGGIIKVTENSGEYPGAIQLFYEGENKDVPLVFTILEQMEEPEEQTAVATGISFSIALIIFPVVLVIIVVIVFLIKFKNKSSTEEQDEI